MLSHMKLLKSGSHFSSIAAFGCFSTRSGGGFLGAKKMASSLVPLIDLAPLMQSNPSKLVKQNILQSILKASTEVGFFTVPTQTIGDADLIERVYKRSDEFHALQDSVKEKYHVRHSVNGRGWTPLYEEPAYEAGAISHVEGFDLAKDLPESYQQINKSLGPNVWPVEVPMFRKDIEEFYNANSKLASVLFESFAEMLGLEKDAFKQYHTDESHSLMRLLNYPQNDAPMDDTNLGITAHTDFECFTIIHQNANGLQLVTIDNEWVDAPEIPDRYVILIGDMLERWTNGVLKATKHRVVNTPWKRQSIIRFNGVNGDTVVQPLPQFITLENPCKFKPTTQKDHIENAMGDAEENLLNLKMK